MPAPPVRLRHQPRIVTSDAEVVFVVRNRLEQTLFTQIKEYKVFFRKKVLLGYANAVYVSRSRTPKVLDALKARLGFAELLRPRIKIGVLKQRWKVSRLNRSVADQHFRGVRLERRFYHSLDDGLMRNHRLHAASSLIVMQHEVWLDENSCAGSDQLSKRTL